MTTMYDQEARWEQADGDFRQLKAFVVDAVGSHELHEVEAELYRRLLALGQVLLREFVAASGTGYDPSQPAVTLEDRKSVV